MPTFDAGEFHAGRRATLVLMLALFAFGAVSGWSGREMFDASRLPPQVAQVAVAEPKEDEPAAKSQQPRKEVASQEPPDEPSESYQWLPAYTEALPAPAEDVPDETSRGYPWTPTDAKPAKPAQVEEFDGSQEKKPPRLLHILPNLAPKKPAEFQLRPSETFEDLLKRWRRFWYFDQPDHANPLRTHGGII